MSDVKHTPTPGPWEYVASTEHHGAYVAGPYGDICDCYTMSTPLAASLRNGGDSYPVPFQGEDMDQNARLIAAAPEMLEALRLVGMSAGWQYMTFETRSLIEAVIAKASGEQP